MAQGVLPGLDDCLAGSPARRPELRTTPVRPNAFDSASPSPNLQGRQLTYQDLVAELRAVMGEPLTDAQVREQIRVGMQSGSIVRFFVNESHLSARAVVRFIRYAATRSLFDDEHKDSHLPPHTSPRSRP